jgi:hypothetical protein
MTHEQAAQIRASYYLVVFDQAEAIAEAQKLVAMGFKHARAVENIGGPGKGYYRVHV